MYFIFCLGNLFSFFFSVSFPLILVSNFFLNFWYLDLSLFTLFRIRQYISFLLLFPVSIKQKKIHISTCENKKQGPRLSKRNISAVRKSVTTTRSSTNKSHQKWNDLSIGPGELKPNQLIKRKERK